ncbi:hypothetical protein FJT64_003648 [Amphibalanus amphitrite]|uniref:C-type lectin domain-containing protein n=1 Tax=Amphibalanus amphitrite TaxID=1232801 RepID=A0A6A4W1G2_AMPAM|nr:hypothetical protein FJT64_003648 [Amphibalanus amphitrite]
MRVPNLYFDFQTSASSCVLLTEVPSASSLTSFPGTLIYSDSDLLDGRVPQQCPSTWTRIGNVCYTTDTASTSSALWEEDSSYCSSAYGPAATLPTFETEEQWGYFVSNISVRVWFNIRYIDGAFQMLGGSKSTFWSSKWEDGQPGSADGFAFFNARSGAMRAVPLDVSPMPRPEVVCMMYAGEP